MANKKSKTVYVVHHTNQGTPESGEIHGIFETEEGALEAMAECLVNDYDSTAEENEEDDYIYMYISEHTLCS